MLLKLKTSSPNVLFDLPLLKNDEISCRNIDFWLLKKLQYFMSTSWLEAEWGVAVLLI